MRRWISDGDKRFESCTRRDEVGIMSVEKRAEDYKCTDTGKARNEDRGQSRKSAGP